MPRKRSPAASKPSAPDPGLIEKLDPTEPASPTEADGAPPPANVKRTVRKAQGVLAMSLLRRFLDADVITQAAALAFYAALSLAPLMLLLLWATASALPSADEAVMAQIRMLVGQEAETVARTVVENARSAPDATSIAGWWSILLLLVGASAVFAQLQDALNRIFRTDATALAGFGDWLRKRVFSFGVLLGMGFLLVVSMTVTTILQFAFSRFDWILPAVATVAAYLVYTLAFAFMYHFLPDRRVRWRLAVVGGAFTAGLFTAGRMLIGWYLEQSATASAYGTMATLVVATLWVYYASIVMFLGAIVTAIVDERLASRNRGRKAVAK